MDPAPPTATLGAPWFDAARYQNELSTKELGRCFIYRRVTTSTMDVAAREFKEGAPSGTVVLAEEQTNSVARMAHRSWSSSPRGNIYMTYLFRSYELLPHIQHMAALAVVEACRSTGITNEAKVKWPNDVWVNGKKLSGNIVRSDTQDDPSTGKRSWGYQIGIGINVNEDMSANETVANVAISLSQVAGHIVDREQVLAAYFAAMESLLSMPVADVAQLYWKHSIFQTGDPIEVHPTGFETPGYAAIVEGLENQFFRLRIRVPGTNEARILMPEEVSVRRPSHQMTSGHCREQLLDKESHIPN